MGSKIGSSLQGAFASLGQFGSVVENFPAVSVRLLTESAKVQTVSP